MKIVIVGAGVVGIASAWALVSRGHDVVVLDRAEGPVQETSAANGGLLTPSMSDPWNAPGCWKPLLRSLYRSDSALQFNLAQLPDLLGWGAGFLWNSRRASFERAVRANLALARLSLKALDELRASLELDFGHQAVGTLRLFRDAKNLARGAVVARELEQQGLRASLLSPEEVAAREPALKPIAAQLAGAIHYLDDQNGDARRFGIALAAVAAGAGVEFRYGIEVRSVEIAAGQATAVSTGNELLPAAAILVCAGSHSAKLLRQCNVHLPIRPAKGYSITVPVERTIGLRTPVVDDALHAVVTPIDGAIRVAGTAEFAGFDASLPEARIGNLVQLARNILPEADLDFTHAKKWSGLRAMSNDGVPFIGPTQIGNLFVNTGHGHLGWTLAMGSAELVATSIQRQYPPLDPSPYLPKRGTGLRSVDDVR